MREQDRVPRMIEVMSETRRETVLIEAIVSVGLYDRHLSPGYILRLLVGEKLLPLEF